MPRGKRAPGPPVTSYDAPALNEQEQVQEKPVESSENQTSSVRSRERDTERVSRLSVPLTGSQGIDWEHMRESNREQVKLVIGKWLRDPAISAQFGVEKPLIEVFSTDFCASLYDGIGQVEKMLAPKLFGVSMKAAEVAFTYDAATKAALAKPTAAVINKYAMDWMIRFKEEIALAFLIFTITGAKIQMARELTILEREQVKMQGKPNGAAVQVEAVA